LCDQRFESPTIGLDLSYRATDALNFNAFYTHDKSRREMASVDFSGNNPDLSFVSSRYWSSRDKDTTNTVGVGFDFDALPGIARLVTE